MRINNILNIFLLHNNRTVLNTLAHHRHLSFVHFLIKFVIYSYYPPSNGSFIERSLVRRCRQSVFGQFYLGLSERVHVIAKVLGILVLRALGGIGSYS